LKYYKKEFKVVNMVKVLILYYSRTGNVEALARAVAEGVESIEGASAELKRVDFTTVYDLISCDAVAFGSPNYFGYMAGLMKDFSIEHGASEMSLRVNQLHASPAAEAQVTQRFSVLKEFFQPLNSKKYAMA
jgi:menaquinone-dependent protoporphyrinogen IX oxidase